MTTVLITLLLAGGLRAAAQDDAALRRLAGESAQLRGLHGAALAAGLRDDPRAVTGRELEVLRRLARAPGVASVVYLDGRGRVRWTEAPELVAVTLGDYGRATGAELRAASEAMASTSPVVRRVPETPVYEAAVPILEGRSTVAVLDLWLRRDGLRSLLAEQAPPAPPGGEDHARQARQSYLAGMAHFEKGDYEKALQEWERARELDPEDRDVAAGLARVRQLLGRSPRAGDAIPLQAGSAFDRSPERAEDQRAAQQHYLAGVIFYQKGDYARARDEWSRALRIDPDNVDAAAGLARMERLVTPDAAKTCVDLYQARRYDDAAAACAACLDQDPASAACAATRRLMEGRVP
ncbi:MAG: tetratricopeptide repeat protein [Elusimicrobia bacterium]|nr:tetratricopeptide repeat protein [Elusimicrobiota bacterium]